MFKITTLSAILFSYKKLIKINPVTTITYFLSTVLIGTFPGIQAFLITDLIYSLLKKNSESSLNLFLFLSIVSFIQIIAVSLQNLTANTLFNRLQTLQALDLINITRRIPIIDLETEDTQFLISRAKANGSSIFYLIEGFQGLLQTIIAFTGFVIYTFSLNIFLCIIFLVSILIYSVSSFIQSNREYESQKNLTFEERQASYLTNILTNVDFSKEVRIYNFIDFILSKWEEKVKKIKNVTISLQKKHYKQNILINGTGFLMVGVFFVSTSISIYYGQANIGAFAGLVSFISQLTPMINNVGSTLKTFNINKNNITELLSFYRTFENELKPVSKGVIGRTSNNRIIRLENVSFKYPNSEKYILKNINLEIKPGQTLAIVGLNGAGKTTLANIIAGIYEPTNGQVFINDTDYSDVDKKLIYNQIGYIFQNYLKIEGTLLQNISLSDESIGSMNSRQLEFIFKCGFRQDELEKVLGKQFENVQLSGGEWQKAAFARTFFHEKLLYILDEPTAALDPKTEVEIFNLFNELALNKANILITHRLGSITHADKIIVINDGEIIEVGTHHSLINLEGQYKRMFDTQAQWYRNGDVVNV